MYPEKEGHGFTYLVLPTEFGQGKTQVKRFLKAAPCLALRLGARVGAGVAVVVGPHPLRALLLGGLGPRLGLGHAGTARHAAAREPVLLCLELGGQAGVGILARALPLLFLGGWRQRDLDLAVDARVVVRGRVAVCVVLGGGARGGRGDLGDLGGRYGVKAGFYQVLDGNLFGGWDKGGSVTGIRQECRRAGTNLLVAEVFVNGLLQTLPDLFACHGLEIGSGKDAVNDAGVGAPLLVSHCERISMTGQPHAEPATAKGRVEWAYVEQTWCRGGRAHQLPSARARLSQGEGVRRDVLGNVRKGRSQGAGGQAGQRLELMELGALMERVQRVQLWHRKRRCASRAGCKNAIGFVSRWLFRARGLQSGE